MARAKTFGKCFEWANASVFQRGTGTCKMGGRVAVGEPAPIQIVFQNKSGHPVQVTNEFWVCQRLCKTFTARYAGWMTIYRKSCQTWRLYVTRKFSCSGASSSFQSVFIKNRDLSKNECLAPLAQDADYCTDTYLGHSWTVRCV